jgi:Flp pilus assembly protein TadG
VVRRSNPSRAGFASAQALVEFALVAPIVFLIIGATVDIGRGVLLYALLQGASRETARVASLAYYSGSNTLPPDCTTLATPCSLSSVVTAAHALDPLGVAVVYQDSSAISSAPGYGSFTPNADPTLPGTITLGGATVSNSVYVFIYEIPSTGVAPSRWSCPSCAAANGVAVRTSGFQRVVVDLKLKWQPVMARFLGIPTVITFDAQTVDRIEF